MNRKRVDGPGDEPFLKVLRPLVETYTAFIRIDARHIRQMGLTQAQFDVIATLGDTEGMTCKDLSEKTLVTKGTLTGVLDRLEKKGYLKRIPLKKDRRAILIQLTTQGEKLFRKVFPSQIYFLKPFFDRALSPDQMIDLRNMLLRLKKSLEQTF